MEIRDSILPKKAGAWNSHLDSPCQIQGNTIADSKWHHELNYYVIIVFQPTRLRSPMTVLKQQRGNCFEYATILCSLLIAQGYDAYVVSGYATREVCLMDSTRETCPLLTKKVEVRYPPPFSDTNL